MAEPRMKIWVEGGGVIEVWSFRRTTKRGTGLIRYVIRTERVELQDFDIEDDWL